MDRLFKLLVEAARQLAGANGRRLALGLITAVVLLSFAHAAIPLELAAFVSGETPAFARAARA